MSTHSKNLSVHSVQSLVEPVTPPNLQNTKNSDCYHLKINNSITNTPDQNSKLWNDASHLKTISNLPNLFEKISLVKDVDMNGKVNKDYLASLNKLPLIALKSEILKLSKDQYGCRFLQKKIDENLISNYSIRQANFDIIFQEIYPHVYELIIDPFGNYLVQKLISYCSEANLNLILEILQYNLFQISINQHGTRALQKVIDNLKNDKQLALLTSGLKPYITELIKDLNGNHVIQKILNKYPPKDCQFIYDSIIADLKIVATHKHGCCVLQKCLNHVTPAQLDQFTDEILKFNNFEILINDQFGNYVLQYLISINSWEINSKVFQNFIGFGLNSLCNLKFSSNVIEKFLKNCFNNEIFSMNFSNLKFEFIYHILINDLNRLINDPYGNYVIQTLIDILINPQINYFDKDGKLRCPSALLVLPENVPVAGLNNTTLQILIVKYWFMDCEIISSFGKRIQSKINMISSSGSFSNNYALNPRQHRSKQLSVSSIPNQSINYHNNFNSEFTIPDQRSFSLSNTPVNNDIRVPGVFVDPNSSTIIANQRFNDYVINDSPFNLSGNNLTNPNTPNQRFSPPNAPLHLQAPYHRQQLSMTSDLSLNSHRSQSSIGSLTGLNQFGNENYYLQRNNSNGNNNNVNTNVNAHNYNTNIISSNNNNYGSQSQYYPPQSQNFNPSTTSLNFNPNQTQFNGKQQTQSTQYSVQPTQPNPAINMWSKGQDPVYY